MSQDMAIWPASHALVKAALCVFLLKRRSEGQNGFPGPVRSFREKYEQVGVNFVQY